VKRFNISVERRPEAVVGFYECYPWKWSVWDQGCEIASGIAVTKFAAQRLAMGVRRTMKMLGGGT
jgi:hypothetical protein